MNMMKENKNKSSHQANKNKSLLSLNVGGADGFGGMVLLGGGLAVAGLMAAFTLMKKKNGGKKCGDSVTPSNKKQDATQGLSFFLQTPSSVHQNSCFTSHETSKICATVCHIDSSEIVSTHSLPLGDEPVLLMDGEKENYCKYRQEISSDGSNFSTEKSSLPVPDGASLAQPEKTIKDESGENVHLTETIQVKKMDEAIESETLAVEYISPMQSVGEEEEEDAADAVNSEEDTIEEREENPEGEYPIEENPSVQSVEDDDEGDGSEENVIEKEKESSEGQFSVEDGVNKKDVSVTTGKWAVEEKSRTPSVEEEEEEEEEEEDDDDDRSDEHYIEKEEEISEGKLSLEQNPPNPLMESVEKENDDEDENNDVDSTEEHVIEKEEESSEGTVCSSIESNVEAIWPAEMLDAFSKEITEMNASNQYSGEKIARKTEKYDFLDGERDREIINEESSNETTENLTPTFHKKATQEVVIMNDQTEHDLKQRIWVSSILVLLLLLLLLYVHCTAVPGDLYHDPVIVP